MTGDRVGWNAGGSGTGPSEAASEGVGMAQTILAETVAGTVQGVEGDAGSRLFAGIPFAAPPVRGLRFRPPQPVEAWRGIRRADRFAPAPAQGASALAPGGPQASSFPTFPTAKITETSEDCLCLNVWVPAMPADAEALPVIVWIYGGGLEAGSAAPPYSDGAALARQTGAVVVAANYRLGAFGHLYLAGLDSRWAECANLALQDQTAALRWVTENIAAFGGDPGNVTVAGQSAGAFAIGALLAAPGAAGLFHKAILHSGSASRIFDPSTATALAEDFLAALRLDDPDGLLHVPTQQILDAQAAVATGDIASRNLPGGRAWGTVLDGRIIPRDPLDAVADGVAARIPLLIGATRDEVRVFQLLAGESFRPVDEAAVHADMRRAGITEPQRLLAAYRSRTGNPGDPGDLADQRCAFLSDAIYRIPAVRLARAQVEAGGSAYHFLLLDEPCGPRMGAFHGSDLLYIFDKLALVEAAVPEHLAVRDTLTDAWTRFVASGDPGWATYRPDAPDNSRAVTPPALGAEPMITEPPSDVAAYWSTRA